MGFTTDRYGGTFFEQDEDEQDERPRRQFKKKEDKPGPLTLAYNELARRVEHNERRKAAGLPPEYKAEYGRGL